jgi:hypothetical protein
VLDESDYIRADWRAIRQRRSVDLAVPFPGAIEGGSLDVHLFFVKLFGCKIVEDGESKDLSTWADMSDEEASPSGGNVISSERQLTYPRSARVSK